MIKIWIITLLIFSSSFIPSYSQDDGYSCDACDASDPTLPVIYSVSTSASSTDPKFQSASTQGGTLIYIKGANFPSQLVLLFGELDSSCTIMSTF
jgi:hypothetical protein